MSRFTQEPRNSTGLAQRSINEDDGTQVYADGQWQPAGGYKGNSRDSIPQRQQEPHVGHLPVKERRGTKFEFGDVEDMAPRPIQQRSEQLRPRGSQPSHWDESDDTSLPRDSAHRESKRCSTSQNRQASRLSSNPVNAPEDRRSRLSQQSDGQLCRDSLSCKGWAPDESPDEGAPRRSSSQKAGRKSSGDMGSPDPRLSRVSEQSDERFRHSSNQVYASESRRSGTSKQFGREPVDSDDGPTERFVDGVWQPVPEQQRSKGLETSQRRSSSQKSGSYKKSSRRSSETCEGQSSDDGSEQRANRTSQSTTSARESTSRRSTSPSQRRSTSRSQLEPEPARVSDREWRGTQFCDDANISGNRGSRFSHQSVVEVHDEETEILANDMWQTKGNTKISGNRGSRFSHQSVADVHDEETEILANDMWQTKGNTKISGNRGSRLSHQSVAEVHDEESEILANDTWQTKGNRNISGNRGSRFSHQSVAEVHDEETEILANDMWQTKGNTKISGNRDSRFSHQSVVEVHDEETEILANGMWQTKGNTLLESNSRRFTSQKSVAGMSSPDYKSSRLGRQSDHQSSCIASGACKGQISDLGCEQQVNDAWQSTRSREDNSRRSTSRSPRGSHLSTHQGGERRATDMSDNTHGSEYCGSRYNQQSVTEVYASESRHSGTSKKFGQEPADSDDGPTEKFVDGVWQPVPEQKQRSKALEISKSRSGSRLSRGHQHDHDEGQSRHSRHSNGQEDFSDASCDVLHTVPRANNSKRSGSRMSGSCMDDRDERHSRHSRQTEVGDERQAHQSKHSEPHKNYSMRSGSHISRGYQDSGDQHSDPHEENQPGSSVRLSSVRKSSGDIGGRSQCSRGSQLSGERHSALTPIREDSSGSQSRCEETRQSRQSREQSQREPLGAAYQRVSGELTRESAMGSQRSSQKSASQSQRRFSVDERFATPCNFDDHGRERESDFNWQPGQDKSWQTTSQSQCEAYVGHQPEHASLSRQSMPPQQDKKSMEGMIFQDPKTNQYYRLKSYRPLSQGDRFEGTFSLVEPQSEWNGTGSASRQESDCDFEEVSRPRASDCQGKCIIIRGNHVGHGQWFALGFDSNGAFVKSLYPNAPNNHDLKIGDRLVCINGEPVSKCTEEEIGDSYLDGMSKTGTLTMQFETEV